jgi:anaerobic selenocysteine-containing dehydrogenase
MSKIPNFATGHRRYRIGCLFVGVAALLTARLLSKRRRTRIVPYAHAVRYTGPAGGWGSAKAVATELIRERVPLSGASLLLHQNKAKGFACVSCAWAKPKSRALEFCENGAKATAWEIDAHRATPEFFANHTINDLLGWSDHQLEAQGRLTYPLRWDWASDKYLPVPWERAFQDIGQLLRACEPKSVVFYTSGRASLETAYMYALMARLYGCNNLPDSSNMCHESTSVALPESIGVPVGTVTLDDFKQNTNN